jgi:hypothetical protein
MFLVKWKFPYGSDKWRQYIPFFPFPYRKTNGGVLFPAEGYSWIMRDELAASFEWMRVFGFEAELEKCGHYDNAMISIEQCDLFFPGNDEKPYAFVAELFEMRRQAKTKKEYDVVEMAIKLALNSLYGKTVQSVGGTEDAPPSCACPYYGAAITAHCRAALLRAALLAPYDIVAFMTDGITSLEPLKGLERVKEVIDGKPKNPDTIIDLGDWEYERMKGGGFLQSGVYYLEHYSGEMKDRTRGANKQNLLYVKDFKELFLNEVIPAWETFDFDAGDTRLSLLMRVRTFVTAGAACASLKRFRLLGRWAEVERWQDIHTLGVKRMLPAERLLYYSRFPKYKGRITKDMIAVPLKELRVDQKKLEAALRTGKPLRCFFLVPSYPAINKTPDTLSKAANPDWLNAEYYEGIDEPSASVALADLNEETADALMG